MFTYVQGACEKSFSTQSTSAVTVSVCNPQAAAAAVDGTIVKEYCFGGGGSEFANRGLEYFGIGLLQMEFLAQENLVEEVFELVAVRIEPILATAFPM